MAGSPKRLKVKWIPVLSDRFTMHAYRLTKEGTAVERSECGLTEAKGQRIEKSVKCGHCKFTMSRSRR